MALTLHYPDPDDTYHPSVLELSATIINVADNLITIEDTYFQDGMAVRFKKGVGNSVLPGGLNETDFFYLSLDADRDFNLLDGPHGSEVDITSVGSGLLTMYCAFILSTSSSNPYVAEFKLGGRQNYLFVQYLAKATETGVDLSLLLKNPIAGDDWWAPVFFGDSGLESYEFPIPGTTDTVLRYRFPLNSFNTKIVAESDRRMQISADVQGVESDGELLLFVVGDTPYTEIPHKQI